MNHLHLRLRHFRLEAGYWMGDAYVPFWQDELRIVFNTNDSVEPTLRQIWILREILDSTHDLRTLAETYIFDYYQQNIFGAIDFGSPEYEQECAPPLEKPDDIRMLAQDPEIWIDQIHRKEDANAVEFKIAFNVCTWDEEHGLQLNFRDWRIVEIGGYH